MGTATSTDFLLWNKGGWPRVDVVGEKFHLDTIRRLFPATWSDGWQEYEGLAHLVPEPHNPHDRNAIAVVVSGNLVGFLAREVAARYTPVLSALVERGLMPTTTCRIRASQFDDWQGVDRQGNDVYRKTLSASATVTLDEPHLCVPANLEPIAPHRMLPHGSALQVKGEENHLDVLAPLVRKHGEAWVHTTLHTLATGTGKSEKRLVELRIDGEPVGFLTPASSAHYLPTIDHLSEQGELVAAKALVKGNAIQVEVVLHAARGHELDADWLQSRSRSGPSPAPVSTAAVTPSPAPEPATASSSVDPVSASLTSNLVVPPKPAVVFRAPPGWPPAPPGWEPGPGWRPEPDWPLPPPGWEFWAVESV